MIEKLTKGISMLIPFLAAYPPWVRILFSLWVLLSAALLLALLLARGPGARAASETSPSEPALVSDKPLFLSIEGVDVFGGFDGAKVKVTAKVNGVEYRYPSLEGVEWMEVSPTMSSQQFRLPRSQHGYDVRFTMILKKHGEELRMVSQKTDHFEAAPFDGRYSLYEVGAEATRSGGIGAQIKYSVRD